MKSALAVIPLQFLLPAPERGDQEPPPSADIQIFPGFTTAAIFEQSALHVIPNQLLIPISVRAAQLTPLSVDLLIFPPLGTVATMVRKSADAAIPYQYRLVELYVMLSLGYDPAGTTEQVVPAET